MRYQRGDSVEAIGVLATAGTIEMVGGSIKAEAKEATKTPSVLAVWASNLDTKVNINGKGGNKVQIDGEIKADAAEISLNMDTADSWLKGLASKANSGAINMTLKKGATWDNRHNAYNENKSSSVTKLIADGGIINQNSDQDITVGDFSGNVMVNYKANVQGGVLAGVTGGDFVVQQASVAANPGNRIVMNTAPGVNTLDNAQAAAALESLANKLQYAGKDDGKLTATAMINEGRTTPYAKAEMSLATNDGRGTIGTAPMNPVNPPVKPEIGPRETMTMRRAPGTEGIWARLFAGETEYDNGVYYKNRYNTVQVGWDRKAGETGWRYGSAVSTDGSSTFERDGGGNSSTALAWYGSWLGERGHYLDIITKQSKLRNEYTMYGMTSDLRSDGSYDTWGTSLSLEYGKRIELKNSTYIEPQVELTWGHVADASYMTRQGMHVDQDDMTSLVGRLGVTYGKKYRDGNLYVKTSLLHEFDGKTYIRFVDNGITNYTGDDFGDTWGEIEFGGTVMMSANRLFVRRHSSGGVSVGQNAVAGQYWHALEFLSYTILKMGLSENKK